MTMPAQSPGAAAVAGVAPGLRSVAEGGPARPALRYHGGKWLLAPWIVGRFPGHRTYIEPFGGAASVLLRKPRSHAEIYNDLDSEVVGLFRVLRSPEMSEELCRRLALTPFAREEFDLAYRPDADPVETARRLVVRSFMGFGSDGFNSAVKTGFRIHDGKRSSPVPSRDWAGMPEALRTVAWRFIGVVIENRPAIQIMRRHDGPGTLHYVDPPYMPATRSEKSRCSGVRYHAYRHEMTEADHQELGEVLRDLRGMVALSGYRSPLYDTLFEGWTRLERKTLADGARPRTECLWLNPACIAALGHGPLWNRLETPPPECGGPGTASANSAGVSHG